MFQLFLSNSIYISGPPKCNVFILSLADLPLFTFLYITLVSLVGILPSSHHGFLKELCQLSFSLILLLLPKVFTFTFMNSVTNGS